MTHRRPLTATEAANYLGLSRRDIANMVAAGILRYIQRPGRRNPVYDPDDLDAAWEAMKRTGPPSRPQGKASVPRKPRRRQRQADVLSFEDALGRTSR